MAFTENSRVRYYKRNKSGGIEDTGFELVHYEGHAAGWEPVDTMPIRGANGPTKKLTGTAFVDDNFGHPLNSNVFYPRTGTAG